MAGYLGLAARTGSDRSQQIIKGNRGRSPGRARARRRAGPALEEEPDHEFNS